MKRTIILSALIAGSFVATACAQAIREFPLNPRAVVDLDVSSEVTTVVFPGPITAIAGAGMLIDDGRASTEVEEGASVRFHVSHAPSSNFVLMRSLRPDASGRLTAIYKNEAYVFELRAVPVGSIASAVFYEQLAGLARRVELPPSAVKFSPKVGLSLLDRARAFPVLVEALPRAVDGVTLSAHDRTVEHAGLRIHVQEVYRFSREDALVFLLRLTNTTESTLDLAPNSFAVRIAQERFNQSIASGPEVLAPGESAEAEFAVVGMVDGTRHDLSSDNAFTILINSVRREAASPMRLSSKEDESPE